MKIRRCMADFHGSLSVTCSSSDSDLSQLIKELMCGHNRDIPIEFQIQSTRAGIQKFTSRLTYKALSVYNVH